MSGKRKKTIEDIRKRIPELKEMAFKSYYRVLLKKWLLSVAGIFVGVVIGSVLVYVVPIPSLPYAPSTIDDLAKSIIGPSVTVNVLCVTFVPVISFFYSAEIKETQREAEMEIKEIREEFTETEDLKVVNSAYDLVNAFWYNFRIGVLKYTRIYLISSLCSLFVLLVLYLLFFPRLFFSS